MELRECLEKELITYKIFNAIIGQSEDDRYSSSQFSLPPDILTQSHLHVFVQRLTCSKPLPSSPSSPSSSPLTQTTRSPSETSTSSTSASTSTKPASSTSSTSTAPSSASSNR